MPSHRYVYNTLRDSEYIKWRQHGLTQDKALRRANIFAVKNTTKAYYAYQRTLNAKSN